MVCLVVLNIWILDILFLADLFEHLELNISNSYL
jgi:hypothetical protein